MSVLTTRHHTNRGIQFLALPGKYVAIGRTSPWTDEQNPPVEVPGTIDLDEIVGFKPVTLQKFMWEDNVNGTVYWDNKYWRLINSDEALELGAIYVFIEGRIQYSELPLVSYRQSGLYTGLELAPGVSTAVAVLPAQVVSNGVLESYRNSTVETRASDKIDSHRFIFKF